MWVSRTEIMSSCKCQVSRACRCRSSSRCEVVQLLGCSPNPAEDTQRLSEQRGTEVVAEQYICCTHMVGSRAARWV